MPRPQASSWIWAHITFQSTASPPGRLRRPEERHTAAVMARGIACAHSQRLQLNRPTSSSTPFKMNPHNRHHHHDECASIRSMTPITPPPPDPPSAHRRRTTRSAPRFLNDDRTTTSSAPSARSPALSRSQPGAPRRRTHPHFSVFRLSREQQGGLSDDSGAARITIATAMEGVKPAPIDLARGRRRHARWSFPPKPFSRLPN